MRNARFLAVTSALALSGAATWAIGCGRDTGDCALALTCAGYADAGKTGCEGDPTSFDGGVPGGCGIFVDPAAGTPGAGTRQSPYQSLQTALDQAKMTYLPVYVCAKDVTEAVVVSPGTRLYGGLDCDHGWTWTSTARTTIKPAAKGTTPEGGSEVALTIEAGSGETLIEDVDVTAPDAAVAGGSSIAVLAAGGKVRLVRGSFSAGNGKDGANGVSGAGMSLDGLDGSPGLGVCQTSAVSPGAMGMTKDCAAAGTSVGGNGGDGGSLSGSTLSPAGAGTDGSPAVAGQGKGGAGQDTMACVEGTKGADGAPGDVGPGADASSPGTLSSKGFAGVAGQDGKDGKPGQGGGGGGGSKGGIAITCNGVTLARVGASGGSGGTGGCGGQHGSGGKPGGASIALVSLGATLALESIRLTAGDGGNGGNGGDGQLGGNYGQGQNGGSGTGSASTACHGGDGGSGGFGGPGGGGRGGHSLGIAYTGAAPKGAMITVAPKGGSGGVGGMGGPAAGGQGADGLAAPVQAFN